jgi:hypothetical protein
MAKIFIRFFSKSQQKWGVRTTYEYEPNSPASVRDALKDARTGFEMWQRTEPDTEFQLDGDDPEMVKQVFGSIKVPEPKPEPEPVIGFLEPEPF